MHCVTTMNTSIITFHFQHGYYQESEHEHEDE